MYAIIKTGGKQYKVSTGDVITVEKIDVAVGEKVTIDEVLLIGNDSSVEVGTPFVGKSVVAEVLEHGKLDKVVIFKYKAKKDYRKKQGHRQQYTKLEIKAIGDVVATENKEAAVKVEEKSTEKVAPTMSMKKDELIAFAKENNITVDAKATKQVILDTINENL